MRHNQETMMDAKKKPFPLTTKRKAFLAAVEKLAKYFDEDGVVKDEEFDADQIADSIMGLFNKLPKSLRNINASAALFGSALYVLQTPDILREVESCSETCKGAAPFEAAFFAGWSLGFESGRKDAQDEMKGDAK